MREVSLTPWQTRFLQLVAAGRDFRVTGGVGSGRALAYSVAAEQFCAPGSRPDGASGVLVVAPSGARYEELRASLRKLGTCLVSAVTREVARMEYLAEETAAISDPSWYPRYALVVVESDGRAPPERALSSVPTGAVAALVEPDMEAPNFDWTGVPAPDWRPRGVSEAVSRALRPHVLSRELCSEWGDRADVVTGTRGRDGECRSGGPWRVAVVVPPECGVSVPEVVSGLRERLPPESGDGVYVLDAIAPGLAAEDVEAGRTVHVAHTPDLLVPPYTMVLCVGPDAASCQRTAERAWPALVSGGAVHVVAPEAPPP
jgi:hypothetical protein